MVIVGITGGIGSGKGLATEFFRSRGAVIIDADEIAHELTRPRLPVLADIADAFGQGIVREDGSLDRGQLGRVVFDDPQALARLNAITHPAIRGEIERRLDRFTQEKRTHVVCIVAPLLLEAGYRESVDRLLVVVADEEERVGRVMARNGLTEEEVKKRMAAQMPPAEQTSEADWVVDTTMGQEDACRQLEAIWAELNA